MSPNQPRTPTRTIRIDDDLWDAVKKKAAKEERTATDVVVTALREYVKRK